MVVRDVKKIMIRTKFIFPSENLTQTTRLADMRAVHCATLIATTKLVLILVLISFYVTRCRPFIDRRSIEINTPVFFL